MPRRSVLLALVALVLPAGVLFALPRVPSLAGPPELSPVALPDYPPSDLRLTA